MGGPAKGSLAERHEAMRIIIPHERGCWSYPKSVVIRSTFLIAPPALFVPLLSLVPCFHSPPSLYSTSSPLFFMSAVLLRFINKQPILVSTHTHMRHLPTLYCRTGPHGSAT